MGKRAYMGKPIKDVLLVIVFNTILAISLFLLILSTSMPPKHAITLERWYVRKAGENNIAVENGSPLVLTSRDQKGVYIYTATITINNPEYLAFIISQPNFQAFSVYINGHLVGSVGDMEKGNSNIWNGAYTFPIDPYYAMGNTINIEVKGLTTYIRGFNLPPFITDIKTAAKYMEKKYVLTTVVYNLAIGGSLVLSIILFFLVMKCRKEILRKKYLFFGSSALLASIFYIDYIPNIWLFMPYIVYKKIILISAYTAVLTLHMGVIFTVFEKKKKPFFARLISYGLAISIIVLFFTGYDMISFKRIYSFLNFIIPLTFAYDSGLLIWHYVNKPYNKIMFPLMFGLISATAFTLIDVIELFINIIKPIPNILISAYGLVIVYIFIGFSLIFDYIRMINEKDIEARKAEVFKTLSMKDKLTWAWSRGYLDEILPTLVGDICVIMLDIDHFKHFNDTYGHQVGDRVLKHIVRIIGETVRDSDIVIRYGGEEFLIILKGAHPEIGLQVAERIRHAIETTPLNITPNKSVNITASLGVCCEHIEHPSKLLLTQMINKADMALYRAKEGGRNRVEVECKKKKKTSICLLIEKHKNVSPTF